MIKVLVTGAYGQLGSCLKDIFNREKEIDAVYQDIDSLDLIDKDKVADAIEKIRPDYVINCAAYTAVDKAEEDKELAFKVNSDAVENLAIGIKGTHSKIIHISTDFVFEGNQNTPYDPDSAPNPVNTYGLSKLKGEQILQDLMPDQSMTLRTAWLYSEYGNNFVKTMLRLMREKPELSVVNDQTGSPTYARGLARLIWVIIQRELFKPGIYHWTDQGNISWYDFACGIQEEAGKLGLFHKKIPIKPILTTQYPTPARRPAYSVLECAETESLTGMKTTPWKENLRTMLGRLSTMGA